jgi:hypothetical protein
MARNSLAKKILDGSTIKFAFANGKELVADVGAFPTNIVNRLALHGAAQKIGDSYAGDSTADEAYASAAKVLAALNAGNWGTEREASEPTPALLMEAIARFKECPIAEAPRFYDYSEQAGRARTDDEKKAIRDNAKIKELVAAIRLERAKKAAETATADEVLA